MVEATTDRRVPRSGRRARTGFADLSRLRPTLSLRTLQTGLGLAWLLNGLLQFQPYMYQRGTDGFLGPVTANTMGPPNLLTDFISTAITFMAPHQVLATTGIGVLQAAIGAGILWRRTVRPALALSVVWALGVWVVGEGAGQLIFPQASMLTGTPGAALVYCLLALVLWPHLGGAAGSGGAADSVADQGLLGGTGARVAWAVIWCGASLLELERSNFAPNAISAQLANAASGEPAPLAWLDRSLAHLTSGVGTELALGLLVLEFLVGWGVLRVPTRRFAVCLGIVVSVIFWIVGQDLGSVLTGRGTDPNLGVPMVLLALALLPRDKPGIAEPSPAL